MAMIDYGVVAKKNGKILTTDFFTDMKDALGFSIEKSDCGEPIEGNYFTYLGDRDFYVGIYKGMLSFFSGNKFIGGIYDLYHEDGVRGKKYRHKETINGIEIDIKRLDEGNRYYGRFVYKGDLYEFIYGYGVDLDINKFYGKNNKLMNKVNRFMRNEI